MSRPAQPRSLARYWTFVKQDTMIACHGMADAPKHEDEAAMADNSDDLDLNTLDDDELVEQMHDDLYDGLQDEIVEASTSCSRAAAGRPMRC
jgi:hypothetical protein